MILAPFFQHIIPQHLLSRSLGKLATIPTNSMSRWLIDRYIRFYGVKMEEAQETNPHAYPDFNSFFIRRLKPALRPITAGEYDIASPVDGIISQMGNIKAGKLLQAKERDYSLCDLLAGNEAHAQAFKEGYFATIYLSPKDYHRVHMPYTGTLQAMYYIPGKLFSVQPATVRTINNIFARNERVVCIFKTAMGPMAIILVGAVIVAGISTTWHGDVSPQVGKKKQHWHYEKDRAIVLARGQEMGHFKLGSTVIVLFSKASQVQWQPSINSDTVVKYGQLLAKRMF